MPELHNPTNQTADEVAFIDKVIEEKRKSDAVEFKTDWRHEAWIDYRALNGTIIAYDEKANVDPNTGIAKGGEIVKKMTISELAGKLGVNRDTLYEWEKTVPNFWDRVNARSKQLASQRRVSFMRDKFYLTAMTWKNPVVSMKWMEQNDDNWKDPRFNVQHEVSDNFAGLLRQLDAAKRAEQPKYVDAEVTSNDATDQQHHA